MAAIESHKDRATGMARPERSAEERDARGGRIDVNDLLSAVSAEALAHAISRHSGGQPRKTGSGWSVCCPSPSHHDKNPSCSVNEKQGTALFHCFSCGASGNTISWYRMARGDNQNFPELLSEIAAEVGFAHAGAEHASPARTPIARTQDESCARNENTPEFLAAARQRIESERARGESARRIIERFAALKRLPVSGIAEAGVHAANRPHKCATENGCDQDGDWDKILCVRAPMMNSGGELVGWQDIIPAASADAHYRGRRKLALAQCKWPMFGLDRASGVDLVVITEGVTDWMTALIALDGIAVVGAMGAERMAETSAMTSESVSRGARMIVVGDGDDAGRQGAARAMAAWPDGWHAASIEPPDGEDLSSAWCRGVDQQWPASWMREHVCAVARSPCKDLRQRWMWGIKSHNDRPALDRELTPSTICELDAWPDISTECGVWRVEFEVMESGRDKGTYVKEATMLGDSLLDLPSVSERRPSSELRHVVAPSEAISYSWVEHIEVRKSPGGDIEVRERSDSRGALL